MSIEIRFGFDLFNVVLNVGFSIFISKFEISYLNSSSLDNI